MGKVLEQMNNGWKASDGVEYLKEGYIAYAEEVIAERAIPNIYDGLKPVHRKIMWTLYKDIKKDMYVKSKTVAGDTMAYHPHTDEAIYKAAVLMTDNHEFTQYPLIDGSGSYGNASTGETAASSRYTEMKIHKNADEFFKDLSGIDFVPNFDSTRTEPTVLPATFPYILCSPSEGIAVGFASKIPSFNFNDVIDLTVEYLRDGYCHTLIAPDFRTGGYYVQNNKELEKLMKVGKANLRLRAKWHTENNNIVVDEVPFGKNVALLCKMIDSKNIDGLMSVNNFSDYEGVNMTVTCRSQNKVDDVLYMLLKDTDLQYDYNANLTVIQDGVPRQLGVYSIIEEWVNWRKKVVAKSLQDHIDDTKVRVRESQAVMALINNVDKKNAVIHLMTTQGKEACQQYVRDNFTRDEIPEDLIKFVCTRSLDTYHSGGKYANEYTTMQTQLKQYEDNLQNLNGTLISQLLSLKSTYGRDMQRHTEVTNVDYSFNKVIETPEEKGVKCFFELKNDFLRRGSIVPVGQVGSNQVSCMSTDKLIMIDDRGRILRCYAKDFPITKDGMGTYLPKYFGFEETECHVIWLGVIDGSTKTILYEDGYIGFLDTSEFMEGRRQAKVIQRGVHTTADKICKIFNGIPEVLLVTDTKDRVSFVDMSQVMRKSRKARTKVFNISKQCHVVAYAICTMPELQASFTDYTRYQAPYVKSVPDASCYHAGHITIYRADKEAL